MKRQSPALVVKLVALALVISGVVSGFSRTVAGQTVPNVASGFSRAVARQSTQAPAPIIVVETPKGSFTFETFPNEAPLSVEHIVALVQAGFYNGQRVHRAVPGLVAQFGDPQSRDLRKRDMWGKGPDASSGHPVGVPEFSGSRVHRKGAVGLAHMGDPAKADSQIYVTLANRPDLDGHYTVFGQVIAGDDVPAKLEVGDAITRMYVKQ